MAYTVNDDDTQYVFSEIKVDTDDNIPSIFQKEEEMNKLTAKEMAQYKKKAIYDCVGRAIKAWNDVKNVNYNHLNQAIAGEYLKELKNDYNDIYMVCPIVLQFMVHQKIFSAKAFSKVLEKTINTKQDYYELQANYTMYLHMDEYKRQNNRELSRKEAFYRKNKMLEYLIERDSQTVEVNNKFKEEKEAIERRKMQKMKDELFLLAKRRAFAMKNN